MGNLLSGADMNIYYIPCVHERFFVLRKLSCSKRLNNVRDYKGLTLLKTINIPVFFCEFTDTF